MSGVPDRVIRLLLRLTLAEAHHTQRYQCLGCDRILPKLISLPAQYRAAAIRACYPSIASQLSWSINISKDDLEDSAQVLCPVIPQFTDLTSVNFTLKAHVSKKGDPGPAEVKVLDTSRIEQLNKIAASICRLPSLTDLSISIPDVKNDAVIGFILHIPVQLQALHLSLDTVQYTTAQTILFSFGQLRHLRHFSLSTSSECSGTAEGMISAGLACCHGLESLCLAYPCQSPRAAAQMLFVLSSLRLRSLTLRYQFSESSASPDDALARAIGTLWSIQQLSLITNTPVLGFGQHILDHWTSLSFLQRLHVCGALHVSCAQPFGLFLQRCSNLEKLQVSGSPVHCLTTTSPSNQTRPPPPMCLIPAYQYAKNLVQMERLTHLDLSDTPASALFAGNALKEVLAQLKRLYCFKWITMADDLNASDPKAVFCYRACAAEFAAALVKVPSLAELHLSGGLLAVYATEKFDQMPWLRKAALYGRIPWTGEFHLFQHTLGCGFDALAKLKDVRLIGNRCTCEVLAEFAEVLAGMSGLEALVLSYQEMDRYTAGKLSLALWPQQGRGKKRLREGEGQGLKQLQLLGLGGCGLDGPCLQALKPALLGLASQKLRDVMLWGNDPQGATALATCLTQQVAEVVIDCGECM